MLLLGSKELMSEKVAALFTGGFSKRFGCELEALAAMLLGSAWAATAAMTSAERITGDLMNMGTLNDVDRASSERALKLGRQLRPCVTNSSAVLPRRKGAVRRRMAGLPRAYHKLRREKMPRSRTPLA